MISIDIYIVDNVVIVSRLYRCAHVFVAFYSLQIYQLPFIVIHCVTACHNDERHLIKDFNKRKE